MLFNMGVKVSSNMPTKNITEIILELDKTFDLVLISEKLDEGLILMKELLCWNFEDILSLMKNARKESTKVSMSESMRNSLIEYNKADVMLYNHFLNKHEEAVNRYGVTKMEEQVSILRSLRDNMLSRCNIDIDESFKMKTKNSFFNRVNAYRVTSNLDRTCRLLMTQELSLISHIRREQIKRIAREKKKS